MLKDRRVSLNAENVEKRHLKLSIKLMILLTIVGILFLIILTEIIIENKNKIKSLMSRSENNAMSNSIALSDSNWMMYRGSPSLLGVAMGKIPNELGLIWKF